MEIPITSHVTKLDSSKAASAHTKRVKFGQLHESADINCGSKKALI